MVVVMQERATEEQIEKVVASLVEIGLDVHRSTGVSRTVLGAVGDDRRMDPRLIEMMDGVSEVLRVTEPYKLASRAFKPEGTVVTMDAAQAALREAQRLWIEAGAPAAGVAGISIRIADLDGLTLGFAEDRVIVLDRDAAGWGWSLDPRAAVSAGRIDLLTVLVHELGHVLGLTHADSGLMFEALAPGVRLSAPQLAPQARRVVRLVEGQGQRQNEEVGVRSRRQLRQPHRRDGHHEHAHRQKVERKGPGCRRDVPLVHVLHDHHLEHPRQRQHRRRRDEGKADPPPRLKRPVRDGRGRDPPDHLRHAACKPPHHEGADRQQPGNDEPAHRKQLSLPIPNRVNRFLDLVRRARADLERPPRRVGLIQPHHSPAGCGGGPSRPADRQNAPLRWGHVRRGGASTRTLHRGA